MKLSRDRILSLLPLAVVFAYVALMSAYAVWIGDDITYRYSFKTGEEIKTLWDIVPSQVAHYFENNGRTVAHFLVQLFIVFVGKAGFAVVNALVNVLFVCLLLKVSRKELSDWKSVALTSGLCLLVFRTKFVPTCQIGYVWMFCLVLGFLLLLKKFGEDNRPGWHWLWLAPFCLLAGWSQESLVIGVGAALIIYVAGHWRSLALAQWVMIVCFGVGGLLLCLSPATMHRTGEMHSAVDFLGPEAMSTAKFLLYMRATYVLIALVLWRVVRKKDKFRDIYRENAFLWNAWAVLIAFNLFVGVFGNRQLFGFELISVIMIVRLIREEKAKTVFSALMLAALVAVCVYNAGFLGRERRIYDNVVTEALSSEDGTVFYNLSAADVTFRETNPSDPFSWYTIGTIERLLHSNGMDAGKSLRILPELCRNVSAEGYTRVAEGTLAVAVEKGNEPEAVVVEREFNVCGIKIPFNDLTLSMENPVFENDRVKVFQIYEKVPCLRNIGVRFVR